MRTGQKHRAVKCHDSLPSTSRAGNARGAAGGLFDKLTLFGMEKDRPFIPGKLQRAFEFFDVGHHAEASLGVWVVEWIECLHPRYRLGQNLQRLRGAPGGDF